ncbi:type IV pilus modification PilV family protein [Thermomonas sp.]
MRRSAGFTLLEAIVALVIFSMGVLALYSWLGVNIKTLSRVQERREVAALTSSAIDALRLVNPMENPRGRREIGQLVMQWDSTLVEPARNAVYQTGIPTIFQVGLYSLDVRLSVKGVELQRFKVRQLGYKQTGALEEE